MKFKKFIALLTATVMTSAVGTNLVLADSYPDIEKNNISNLASTVAEAIQNAKTLYDSEASDVYADLCIELDDTGRALLGMMSPIDITWLNNLGLEYSVSYNNSAESLIGDIYLNDASVCSIEYYLDAENMCYYIRIPELNDSYLVMKLADTADAETVALYDTMSELTENPALLLPDASAIEDIFNRYGEILTDGFTENQNLEDTISIEGVSMDCTALEGQMQLEDIQSFLTNLLTTASTDEQIKEIIETWAPFFQTEDTTLDVYQEFQNLIYSTLLTMNEEPLENNGTYVSSNIWQASDGSIVGRQLSIHNGAEEIPLFTYKAPASDSDKAFYLEIGDGIEYFSISGKGTITDGKLNGNYDFMYNDVVMASVEIMDADTTAAENDSSSGSYKFILQPGIGEEEYSYLSSFAILADVSTNEESSVEELKLTLTMSDAALFSLSLNAGFADAMDMPDFAAFTNVLDVNSEDDMTTYISEMDWAPILENCIAAGMTEEVAAALDDMIYESLYGATDDAE